MKALKLKFQFPAVIRPYRKFLAPRRLFDFLHETLIEMC